MPTVWPPFDLTASECDTETRVFMGGPRPFVARATVAEGQPLVTTASATLDGPRDIFTSAWPLSSAAAFLRPAGVIFLVGPKGDNWLTYQAINGDTLLGVTRLSGEDDAFPDETPVAQWRDITSSVKEIRWGFRESGGAYPWSASLTGEEWSSLIQFQDAMVYIEQRYWNSTYGAAADEPVVDANGEKLADSGWTDWIPVFIGYLDPVRVTGSHEGTSWTVTARCESKYLAQQPVVPKTYGEATIEGTNTASSTLGNPAFEPTEGDGVNTFDPDKTADENKRTLWISQNAPSLATPLPIRPTGFIQVTRTVPESSGLGIRINQLFISGIETGTITQQQQIWIELANTNREPPNEYPFVPDLSAPGGPIAAADDGLTYGSIDVTGLALHNNYGQVVYLGSKNGYGLEPKTVARGTSEILAYDKGVFDQMLKPPEGIDVFEFKQCDGFQQAVQTSNPIDPSRKHRGIGAAFTLDPRGGWLAIRGGAPRVAPRYGTGSPAAAVVTDGCSPSTGRGTIEVDSTAGFSSEGYLYLGEPGTPQYAYYSGIAGNTFTGVVKFTAFNVKGAGVDVRQAVFSDTWFDFVAWGDPSLARPVGSLPRLAIPTAFWQAVEDGGGFAVRNQNDTGVEGQRVWGWRGNDGYTNAFDPNDVNHRVAPGGIPVGQSIRRKNALGGGVYQGSGFSNHDGGTSVDWELLIAPRIGTAASEVTSEYLWRDLGEHIAAVVVSDDSDVGAADGSITVGTGQGDEYEATMPAGLRAIRAGSTGIEFRYDHCDETTFYGVVKTQGAGLTIPPGTELVKLIDTNPRGSTDIPRIEPGNLHKVSAIKLGRYRDNPTVAVIEDRSAIDSTLRCLPGSTRYFPNAGDLLGPGVPGTPYRWGFRYTGKTNDVFTGVTPFGYTGRPMPAGSSVSLDLAVSLVTRLQIRGSRRRNPNDPLTYLSPGGNPDWEDLVVDGRMTGADTIFSLDGTRYYRHLVVIVKEMSDGGRAKLNTMRVYKTAPRLVDENAATRLPPGQIQSGTAAAIFDEMLHLAGVPAYRRDLDSSQAIPAVPRLRVGQGTVWATGVSLMKSVGCWVTDGPLAKIRSRRKRSMPGGGYQATPPARLTTAAIIGEIEMEPQPRHQAGQVRVEWESLSREEAGAVTYPTISAPLGDLVTLQRVLVANETEARNIAVLKYLEMNGGERIRVTINHACMWQPEDIVRVEASTIDAAGRKPEIDCLVIGMDAMANNDGQEVTLTLKDFRSR